VHGPPPNQYQPSERAAVQERKNRAKQLSASPGETVKDYRERRKFSTSCFWLGVRASKFASAVLPSDPLLA
jgi:hypothetical protein